MKQSLGDYFFKMKADVLALKEREINLINNISALVNRTNKMIEISESFNQRLLFAEKNMERVNYNMKVFNRKLDDLKQMIYEKQNI